MTDPFDTVQGFIDLPFQERWGSVETDADDALAEIKERLETAEDALGVANAFAHIADAYCWDPETITHDDLMNARAAWQTEVGRMKLRTALAVGEDKP